MSPKLLKAFLSCFLIAISASVLVAQEMQKKENVSGFNAISVSSGIDLYLTQSNTEEVVLKGTKELMEKVKVYKGMDGILKFEVEKGTIWSDWTFGKNSSVKAYVSFKTLNKLMATGGSDVFSQGHLKFKDLMIKSSGGSDLKLDLEVEDLKIMASGGSDVYLKGRASKFILQANGGSDVKAFGLIADEVNAQMSGGSDGELYALKTIDIVASGASDVDYKGPATKKSVSSSGASDVRRLN